MKKMFAAAAITLSMSSAFASIVGDTVNLSYYFPNSSSLYEDLGTQVIPSGEANYSFSPYFYLLATDTSFYIEFTSSATWAESSFNGIVITDLTKNFAGPYTLADSSTMTGLTNANLSFGGNTVGVNWQGLSFNSGTKVILTAPRDATATVPEPTTIALLGLGLLGFAASRRKSANSKNA